MPDVLIRDVPEAELSALKSAAAARDVSLQAYLRYTVHAHTEHLHREKSLAAAEQRLSGRVPVPDEERLAVLDAIHVDSGARGEEFAGRAEP